jgi:hypothetical protein
MIKQGKAILWLFGLLLFFTACQKDDICPESTQATPLLIVRFIDAADRVSPRSPANLQVKYDTTYYFSERQNVDSIAIPLRTSADNTQYEFILNAPAAQDSTNNPNTNIDILTFSYGRNEVYLNRGCAFKMEYTGLQLNISPGEDGSWIQSFAIDQTNVTDETNRHISIFY